MINYSIAMLGNPAKKQDPKKAYSKDCGISSMPMVTSASRDDPGWNRFCMNGNGLLQPSCRSLFVILQPKSRTERYVSNDMELKVL